MKLSEIERIRIESEKLFIERNLRDLVEMFCAFSPVGEVMEYNKFSYKEIIVDESEVETNTWEIRNRGYKSLIGKVLITDNSEIKYHLVDTQYISIGELSEIVDFMKQLEKGDK